MMKNFSIMVVTFWLSFEGVQSPNTWLMNTANDKDKGAKLDKFMFHFFLQNQVPWNAATATTAAPFPWAILPPGHSLGNPIHCFRRSFFKRKQKNLPTKTKQPKECKNCGTFASFKISTFLLFSKAEVCISEQFPSGVLEAWLWKVR